MEFGFGITRSQRIARIPQMGGHGPLPRTGDQLSRGEMVGRLDGIASSLWRKFWRRRSRRQPPPGTRRSRTSQRPAHPRDQLLMRLFRAQFVAIVLLAAGLGG